MKFKCWYYDNRGDTLKNYYKMLGYDPNFSEEELLKKISSDKEKYLMEFGYYDFEQ